MAKPVAPQVEVFQSPDIQQIGYLQAEIESLRELQNKKAIGEAEAADQIRQRQRAQVLLCRKGVPETPTLVLSAEERKAALAKAAPMIASLEKRKLELEKAMTDPAADKEALEADLTKVKADLAILKRAEDMLNRAPA